MALPPFATTGDLTALSQNDVPEAAAALALALASALIRRWTRQVISRVVDDTVTLRAPDGPELVLPQRPVQSVSAVTSGGVAITGWVLVGNSLVLRCGSWCRLPGRSTLVRGAQTVTVTYTHGWSEIPDDVRAVCLDIAAMTVTNPSGLRTVAIDDYSRTFASETLGAGTLSEDHKAILSDYRRRIGTVTLR